MVTLDVGHLTERLAPIGVHEVRPLTGGASSLTYAGAIGERRIVVKAAPPGVPPVLNRDVLRQARLMRALRTSEVPVPDVLWEDEGTPPDVPPVFVMAFVPGTSLEPLFDLAVHNESADTVAARLHDAARVMARLHRLAPHALGLDDEPVVGVADEIQRWCRLLQTVDAALVPGWEEVASALQASTPAALPAGVVHGDFRLGNMLAVRDRITAVIDWEIWSVGDPRVDAGWFLLNVDPDTYRRATPYVGLTPSPAELAATYVEAIGRPVPDLAWFQALAAFKSAATWSLIVKHNRRRTTPDPDHEAMAETLPHLLAHARDLLGRSPVI